jgi:hypothetical protein
MMKPIHTADQEVPSPKISKYKGEVVYMYAFDMAYEMKKQPIRELLGQTVAQFSVDASKRSPKHLFFYKPQIVRLPPLERIGPDGPVRIERAIKLLPIGAVSITVKIPFEVTQIEDLVEFHDLRFSNGSLHDEVKELAQQIRQELLPYCIRPVTLLAEEEAYTVFCINSPFLTEDGSTVRAETWLKTHRREVAALLTREPDIDRLSAQESDESTDKYLSYYDSDVCVVDHESALILDYPQNFAETVYAMELGNLQLTELEAYDRILDDSLERAYRDLTEQPMRSRSTILKELREIRIDLARCSDELSNITKFFGDYHISRIYGTIAARFHLSDWHRTIDNKLKTLDNLYQMLTSERNNRWMFILEITIVLLFIIDVGILLLGVR